MEVISGVPQGSVLGPLLFVIYINDLPEKILNSEIFLYADDTKVFRRIKDENDCRKLQEDLNRMNEWSKKWLLRFHPKKCNLMRIGKTNIDTFQYTMDKDLNQIKVEKDLGVMIDQDLNFNEHFAEKINKANMMTGLIRRTFVALDEEIFKSLYVALIRPYLEYANQVWCSYKKKDAEAVERVQRRTTKLIPSLKDLSYEERLKKLDLPILAYRRSRGNMVETFKIVNGVYDRDVCEDLLRCRKNWKLEDMERKYSSKEQD